LRPGQDVLLARRPEQRPDLEHVAQELVGRVAERVAVQREHCAHADAVEDEQVVHNIYLG
jgi:hypothetical protein